ncbi:MAG: 3-deoxy-7-phosphoheptulonate synthase [Firmicutes bacterium]|nr:3-deoxy-7-phosphoheptulonate synthase [Bacillota bacterium]
MSPDLEGLRQTVPLVAAIAPGSLQVKLGEAVIGGPAPVVIAGPCAVESLEQVLKTARRVKAAGAQGLRGGAFKSRSSPYSFQGLGRPALEMLAAAKVETGLFLTIEVTDQTQVELVAEYADLIQIGARNMQNFALLRAVGRTGRPVLLKRGLSATIQEWLQAAEYILAEGNRQVILCERGIRTFETLTRNTFDVSAIPLLREITGLPVIADPSHAAGRRELVAPLAKAALAAGAQGLLIEVHPQPEAALSDGPQSITPEEFAALMGEIGASRAEDRRRSFFPRKRDRTASFDFHRVLAAEREGYRYLPVYHRFVHDELTPVGVYRRLAGDGPCFLLESVESDARGVSRYSFYGDRPLLCLSAYGDRLGWEGNYAGEKPSQGDVLAALRNVLAGFAVAPAPELPRFFGGAVGYLGYGYVHQLEPIPFSSRPDPIGTPDAFWMIPERVVILDHVTRTVTVVVLAPADLVGFERAQALIAETMAALGKTLPPEPEGEAAGVGAVESNFTQAEFVRAVLAAKEAIAAGEIFQVVLSRRLSLPYRGKALALYRALRTENPSPYLFLLDCGGFQVIGSSPETMVRLEGKTAELKPLAGTRPRGQDEETDRRLEAELRADEKELAEHVMLVDLGRNDLGRVCRYGTVRVPELITVERFSRVMHIVSRVTGELAPGQDAFSLLAATFPAGTLTGAPKVRAMQIIAELEPHERGIYGGAVGYFGFNGNMDTCIAIRTIVLKDGMAYVQAGAGIVADSDPAREFAETTHTAAAVLAAVRRAGEGDL